MVEEALRAIEEFDVPFVCVKVGPTDHLASDVRVVSAIRRRAGAAVQLGLDANTSYDFVDAVRLLDSLKDCAIAYFEQPFAVRSMNELIALRMPCVERDALVRNAPIDAKNGHCTVPTLPGLGIDIDTAMVAKVALASAIVH